MKAIVTALLVVAGLALFVWLIANPIADAISTARLREIRVLVEADTDSRAVALAAAEARADVVAALETAGVHVLAGSGSSDRNGHPEILITVHGYERHEAGSRGPAELVENVEFRLCDPPPAGQAGPCAPRWWRATPLERVPGGTSLPVRDRILALVAEFIADHHFPTRPAVPPNPRHLGWT